MALPRSIARFNRNFGNHFLKLIAGWMPGFAILHHRGRRSGRDFATPICIFRHGGGYRVALTYSSESDWVKNVLAAGGCTIVTRGRRVVLGNPRLGCDAARSWLPSPARQLLGLIHAFEYLQLNLA